MLIKNQQCHADRNRWSIFFPFFLADLAIQPWVKSNFTLHDSVVECDLNVKKKTTFLFPQNEIHAVSSLKTKSNFCHIFLHVHTNWHHRHHLAIALFSPTQADVIRTIWSLPYNPPYKNNLLWVCYRLGKRDKDWVIDQSWEGVLLRSGYFNTCSVAHSSNQYKVCILIVLVTQRL